ncbi:MAG: SDR family NAD(P)-dependent oxidoreductase [Pirellulaceae bacterium]
MSDMGLAGKVAIVTGASLGIGRATALALGQAGSRVVVNYHSNEGAAAEVVRAIRDAGSMAVKCGADVSEPGTGQRLVDCAISEFGRLDVAVSNAASSERVPFVEADLDAFRRTVDVTMWGAFYFVRAAARQMIRQGDGGAMVIVSSPHAYIPFPSAMAYNMAKAGLEQMAKTAATELAQHRIRINLVQPGWTDTPGERKFSSEESLRAGGAKLPFGRLGTPEEMADGILFLCDPRSAYTTGATLLIDGGYSLPWWSNDG